MTTDTNPFVENLDERCDRPLIRRSMLAYGELFGWGDYEDWGRAQRYEAWAVVEAIHGVVRDEIGILGERLEA